MLENMTKSMIYSYLTSIFCEIYGFAMTRNVIFLGFVLNIISVVIFSIAIILPSNSPSADAFATILGTTPRLFIAGLVSYLISNIINSQIMVKLKENTIIYYLSVV